MQNCTAQGKVLSIALQTIAPKWPTNTTLIFDKIETYVASGALHVLLCLVHPQQWLPQNLEFISLAVLAVFLSVVQCGMLYCDVLLFLCFSIFRLPLKLYTVSQGLWAFILSMVLCELAEQYVGPILPITTYIRIACYVLLCIIKLQIKDDSISIAENIEIEDFAERAWAGPKISKIMNENNIFNSFTKEYTRAGYLNDSLATGGGYNGDLIGNLYLSFIRRNKPNIFRVNDENFLDEVTRAKEKQYDTHKKTMDIALITYLPYYATYRARKEGKLKYIVKRGEYLWTCIVVWLTILTLIEFKLWTVIAMIFSMFCRIAIHVAYRYIPGPCGRMGLIHAGKRFITYNDVIERKNEIDSAKNKSTYQTYTTNIIIGYIISAIAEVISFPTIFILGILSLIPCFKTNKTDDQLKKDIEKIIHTITKMDENISTITTYCSKVRTDWKDWLTAKNKVHIVGQHYDTELRNEILGHWIKRIWELIIDYNKKDKSVGETEIAIAHSAMLFCHKYEEGSKNGQVHWLERKDTNRDNLAKHIVEYLFLETLEHTDKKQKILEYIQKELKDVPDGKYQDADIAQKVSADMLNKIWNVYYKHTYQYSMFTLFVLYIEWLSICNRRQNMDILSTREKDLFSGFVCSICRYVAPEYTVNKKD